jgi:GNAT superfamily N-acetyltransferase
VRRADARDADQLAALINAAYDVERWFKTGERISAEEIPQLMERGVFLVREDGPGRILATVYVKQTNERCYFGLLAVDPSAQGSGLGREMIAAAEQYAIELGCAIMDIHVLSLRPELPPFYRRLGYAESGIEDFDGEGLTRPCHVIVMSKPLL